MIRHDTICDICGASDFHPFAKRSDGVQVIVCGICGHGIVAQSIDDVRSLYEDRYFGSTDSSIGYEEYEYTAEQGLAWAASLVPLLRKSGRVLDIGCANGRLLEILGPGYERFGIELNLAMAKEARRRGTEVIAQDLLDPQNLDRFENYFDVALAIAVFEHISDFKRSVERALQLLKPTGLLLFEVPLIRTGDDVWFRSSLEHVHYPTERSLQFLFREVLGLYLAGSTLVARDYGCVYVGLTSRSRDVAREVGEKFERLTKAPIEELGQDELRFRWLYDFIHAAKVMPELLRLSKHLFPSEFNPMIVRRIFDLWATREEGTRSIEEYLHAVEQARDWHACEWKRRDNVIASQQQLLVEAERAGTESTRLASERELELNALAIRLKDKSLRVGALESALFQKEKEIGALQIELDRYKDVLGQTELERDPAGHDS